MSNNNFLNMPKKLGNVLLNVTSRIVKELTHMNENYAKKVEDLDKQGMDFWNEDCLKRRCENATNLYEKQALFNKLQERKTDKYE